MNARKYLEQKTYHGRKYAKEKEHKDKKQDKAVLLQKLPYMIHPVRKQGKQYLGTIKRRNGHQIEHRKRDIQKNNKHRYFKKRVGNRKRKKPPKPDNESKKERHEQI